MVYVVAEEYLQAYGSEGFINASTKWQARRDVLHWLTGMVSKHRPSSPVSNARTSESIQALGSREHETAGISDLHAPDRTDMVPRRLKVHDAEIEWSGVYWICSKQLRHYPAFRRNEITIAVHSFVFVRAEEESYYVGYLEDLYEDKRGQKKVKVRWFYHNREIKRVLHQLNPHPREIFITPHVQAISAECIDGRATVLTPKHYEKCLATFSHSQIADFYMCFRQFKSNKVKPFSLSKLRGYSNQRVLSSLNCPLVSKHRTKGNKANGEEDDNFAYDDHGGRGAKRNRSCGAANSIPRNQITNCEPIHKKLRIKLPTREVKSVRPQGSSHASFKVGEKIELLCQDSGIRGCWFRCEILQASEKRFKVKYVDVHDADASASLEEWVPASKLAASDKLGMRCSGRLTVRPWPSEDSSDCSFEVGAPVDAWWSDGWWEGVVTEIDRPGDDNLQVYFPGCNRFLTLKRKNVRTSRDWVGNRWVDIKAKPHILSYVSSNISPSAKFPKCSVLAEASDSGPSALVDCEILNNKHKAAEDIKGELLNSAPSTAHDTEEVDLMKQLCIGSEDKVVKGVDTGNGAGNEARSVLDLGPANQKFGTVEGKGMELVPQLV
ncbi:hypothetical protein Vadar_029273 [Vaccinium darrowii]|uniref:Uncharacterized protein n=1 Tax=Vaccinium darrowii TaxID=229202 RepID=A0ACB7XDF6_9ERIC|nr:hypothetical protein Vadar_029273 [Vaccinium darrowii]